MQERITTEADPFHYVDSGLANVYLVGIRVLSCGCGRTLADIPAIKQLHELIARDLVKKSQALTGEEIRFLRKRLGKKQVDLAKEFGIEPETLSRIENGHQSAGESTDKLIRLHYAISSGDRVLHGELTEALQTLFKMWAESQVPRKIVAAIHDNQWSEAKAA